MFSFPPYPSVLPLSRRHRFAPKDTCKHLWCPVIQCILFPNTWPPIQQHLVHIQMKWHPSILTQFPASPYPVESLCNLPEYPYLCSFFVQSTRSPDPKCHNLLDQSTKREFDSFLKSMHRTSLLYFVNFLFHLKKKIMSSNLMELSCRKPYWQILVGLWFFTCK